MLNLKEIENWILSKKGVITASSTKVYRESYFGNNIIAPNSEPTPDKTDKRGYAPVELWIMSAVEADNPIRMPGEGITKISIAGSEVPLTSLKETANRIIFGQYADLWPLTKVLDIGGQPVQTSFGNKEIPPIPAHVHGGAIIEGKVLKPGKSEAYFFPPTNIPPYNKEISAKTRIGLKQGITKENVKKGLMEFGKSDSMFTLLNEFDIKPMTGWTVPEGVLHAPGPYLTFEIQLPQDDYNLASWRLGERLDESERTQRYKKLVLRGLDNEDVLIESILDWPQTCDQNLKQKYFHNAVVIESGNWGRRLQIFFDQFYGEGWEVLPGQTLNIPAKDTPQAGIVWSGKGEINGNFVSQPGQNEFLCVPKAPVAVTNQHNSTLYIYTVEPIRRLRQ
ncbi:MAG: hypothetical protein HY451_01730 [Parcubacteria group bacterium]|nr:hypothetical protein [Parcubacteria group bacterium]